MKDYSQDREQGAILAAVGHLREGRFLDVGAWHAEVFSNVRALYELGWTGVLMEPHPGHAAALRAAYPPESGVVVVEAAAGVVPGRYPMRVTDDATSTLHDATYEKWRAEVDYAGIVDVDVVVLETVFAVHGSFDVVSLDAEGWSVPLLDRLLALGERPYVIVVEYDDLAGRVEQVAPRFGYRVAFRNRTNIVLVRSPRRV